MPLRLDSRVFSPRVGETARSAREGVQGGKRPPLGDYIYNNKSFKRQKRLFLNIDAGLADFGICTTVHVYMHHRAS
jgi:hypothetical protein